MKSVQPKARRIRPKRRPISESRKKKLEDILARENAKQRRRPIRQENEKAKAEHRYVLLEETETKQKEAEAESSNAEEELRIELVSKEAKFFNGYDLVKSDFLPDLPLVVQTWILPIFDQQRRGQWKIVFCKTLEESSEITPSLLYDCQGFLRLDFQKNGCDEIQSLETETPCLEHGKWSFVRVEVSQTVAIVLVDGVEKLERKYEQIKLNSFPIFAGAWPSIDMKGQLSGESGHVGFLYNFCVGTAKMLQRQSPCEDPPEYPRAPDEWGQVHEGKQLLERFKQAATPTEAQLEHPEENEFILEFQQLVTEADRRRKVDSEAEKELEKVQAQAERRAHELAEAKSKIEELNKRVRFEEELSNQIERNKRAQMYSSDTIF